MYADYDAYSQLSSTAAHLANLLFSGLASTSLHLGTVRPCAPHRPSGSSGRDLPPDAAAPFVPSAPASPADSSRTSSVGA